MLVGKSERPKDDSTGNHSLDRARLRFWRVRIVRIVRTLPHRKLQREQKTGFVGTNEASCKVHA